jgi:DNA-directed RNA polymerase I, II, and III subunit RPABC2
MSKKKTSYFDDDDTFEEDNQSDNDKSSDEDEDDDEEDDDVQDEILEDNDNEQIEENDTDDESDDESEEESINEELNELVGGDENIDEDGNIVNKKSKKSKKITINPSYINPKDEDEDDGEDDGEIYLKKFDKEINENYIINFHPECALQNYDEIFAMTKVVRDEYGIIVDELHRTIPYLTKYERARILGQRAKQINAGATPFVKVPENVIDGYLIAELELQQKRIPFIIRRPLPNGGSEYWSLKDLENITF